MSRRQIAALFQAKFDQLVSVHVVLKRGRVGLAEPVDVDDGHLAGKVTKTYFLSH
jgi:hypothetical protein